MKLTEHNVKDHYPFGMLTPGRNWSAGSEYRFGFNGKESDTETYGEGNAYDFGARIYDARLGRWMSRDPLEREMPAWSTYCFAFVNPINWIDPNGMKADWVKNDENGEYSWNDKVTSPSNTPVGFVYIGKEDKSIIEDLFGSTTHTAQSIDLGVISIDDYENPYQSNGGAGLQTSVKTTLQVSFSANVSDKKFNGVNVFVSITGEDGIPRAKDQESQVYLSQVTKSMTVNGVNIQTWRPDPNTDYINRSEETSSLYFETNWSAESIYQNYESTIPLNFNYRGNIITNSGWVMSTPTSVGLLGIPNAIKIKLTIEFANYANSAEY
ncbi:MAG: RHS repeat-associated core domain-containing protein [Chitinophagales bacterium]